MLIEASELELGGPGEDFGIAIAWTFAGRLDISRLSAGLQKLGKAWPYVCSTVTRTKDSRLCFQVPDSAKADFDVSSSLWNQTLSTVRPPLLHNTGISSIQVQPETLKPFSEVPVNFNLTDYEDTGRQVLGIHFTCLLDATIMTLAAPHAAIDGNGIRYFLDNWFVVLQGQVPDHITHKLNTGHLERFDLSTTRMSGWRTVDSPASTPEKAKIIASAPITTVKTVHLGEAQIKALQKALEDSQNLRKPNKKTYRFSASFTASAYFQYLLGSQSSSTKHTENAKQMRIKFGYLCNYKTRIPDIIPKTFLRNGFSLILTKGRTPRELAKVPFLDYTMELRHAVKSQGSAEAAKRMVSWKLAHFQEKKLVSPVELHDVLFGMTSWVDFQFTKLDFSSILMDDQQQNADSGKVIDLCCPSLIVDGMSVVREDQFGGFYAHVALTPDKWTAVETAHGTLLKEILENSSSQERPSGIIKLESDGSIYNHASLCLGG